MTIWRQHIHKVVLRLPDSWPNWNLEMLVFEEREKPGYREKNLSEQTNYKLNPHMASTPGFEPGPHWWEASAFTTAPSLAPENVGVEGWGATVGHGFDLCSFFLFSFLFFFFIRCSSNVFTEQLPRLTALFPLIHVATHS